MKGPPLTPVPAAFANSITSRMWKAGSNDKMSLPPSGQSGPFTLALPELNLAETGDVIGPRDLIPGAVAAQVGLFPSVTVLDRTTLGTLRTQFTGSQRAAGFSQLAAAGQQMVGQANITAVNAAFLSLWPIYRSVIPAATPVSGAVLLAALVLLSRRRVATTGITSGLDPEFRAQVAGLLDYSCSLAAVLPQAVNRDPAVLQMTAEELEQFSSTMQQFKASKNPALLFLALFSRGLNATRNGRDIAPMKRDLIQVLTYIILSAP